MASPSCSSPRTPCVTHGQGMALPLQCTCKLNIHTCNSSSSCIAEQTSPFSITGYPIRYCDTYISLHIPHTQKPAGQSNCPTGSLFPLPKPAASLRGMFAACPRTSPASSERRQGCCAQRTSRYIRPPQAAPAASERGRTHTSEGGRGTKCRERPISRWIPPQTPAGSRSCAHPAPPASETDRPFRRFHPADGR